MNDNIHMEHMYMGYIHQLSENILLRKKETKINSLIPILIIIIITILLNIIFEMVFILFAILMFIFIK